jgi:hypothetical protein
MGVAKHLRGSLPSVGWSVDRRVNSVKKNNTRLIEELRTLV